MKITVVGASGLIGTGVVEDLRAQGHEVVSSSRSTGVDVLTGAGLADALAGADVLVDVTNSPRLDGASAMAFFSRAAPNLVGAARAAGVGHYVALSIVGVDGLPDSGYMRAKVVQERAIRESGIPYTIVRATQFTEFTDAITDSLVADGVARVPDARIQPIPAAQVSAAVAEAAVGQPLNGVRNVGGPHKISFEQMARDSLTRRGDQATTVVVDPEARYYGAALATNSLVTPD
ncbi:MAG TPA: NAD(P)H-binding protein [Candidatus Limnocylindria bacterium]|nr:NAD(P)H-binding protein [Candidatus Limnocylindria bacterium]